MEFISEGIFEKYSKMKILVFEIFEKGQILRPFSGLAPSKLKFFSNKFNGSICAYRVFYIPIFRRIEGSGESTPRSLRYRKKRGSERVNEARYMPPRYEIFKCMFLVFLHKTNSSIIRPWIMDQWRFFLQKLLLHVKCF